MTAYRSFASTPHPLRSALRCGLVLISMLTLAACSLPKAREGEMRLHTLQLNLPASVQPALARQLLVELPTAAAPISSDRVAVRIGDSEYGVLRGLRWSEPAPRLWQSLLVRAIEDDGRLSAGRDRDSLFGDERLLGELRAFEYLRDSGHVRVHYHAKRVDAAQRVVASRSFTAEVAVDNSEPEAVIAGFHAAARQLLPELIEWLVAP